MALAVAGGLYAQDQRIIPLSSPVYAQMDALYLVCGLGTPSTARPWTAAETLMILRRIDPPGLSSSAGAGAGARAGASALYDSIEAEALRGLRLDMDGIAAVDARLEYNLELYAHSNGGDYYRDTDWLYGYEERQPMVRIPLELSLGAYLYITTDIQYGRSRYVDGDTGVSGQELFPQGIGAIVPSTVPVGTIPPGADNQLFILWSGPWAAAFLTNQMASTFDFDFAFPKRAVFSTGGATGGATGGGQWNLSIGRDRISWGNGNSGNFIFDNHVDYTDFIRFSTATGAFRYEIVNAFYWSDPYTILLDSGFRVFMTHRLEFRILPTLVFTISENVMYKAGVFNPVYLNPAFIYHNLFERNLFNALAHAEIDFAFMPGFNAYAQFALDQAQAPNEGDSQSGAWGLLGGVEYGAVLGPGVLTASLEAAYTAPLLYRRDIVDFLRVDTIEMNGLGWPFFVDYIGYSYGGDVLALQFDAAYQAAGSFGLSLRLLGMVHGQMNFYVSHNSEGDNAGDANIRGASPSGGWEEAEKTLALSLRGSYSIPRPLSWLELSVWAALDYIVKTNKFMLQNDPANPVYQKSGVSQDLQFSLGFGVKL